MSEKWETEGYSVFIQNCGAERKAKDAVVAGLELEGGRTRTEGVWNSHHGARDKESTSEDQA